eukprot:3996802-Alexandrium_andersonii.AAC.1
MRCWLAGQGMPTDRLTRDEASRCRTTWLAAHAQRRVLRSAELGRTPRRRTTRTAVRLGRAWIKTKHSVGHIQRPDGTLATDRGEALEILRGSRQE